MKKWFAGFALAVALITIAFAGGQVFADQADHPDPTGLPVTATL
ncbi:hypothetical protein [Bacillus oleivorans]|nr:hypothetical protein [Bacillus oleivorans]